MKISKESGLALAAMAVGLFCMAALGASGSWPAKVSTVPGQYYGLPGGYVQDATVSGVTHLTVPTGAVQLRIQPESQNIRWRDDYSYGKMTGFTDANTAVLLMDAGHGIDAGDTDTVSVWWGNSNERTGMTATVTGNSVVIDAGAGTDLTNVTGSDTVFEVGIDPTTAVGNLIEANAPEFYEGELERFRFIEAAASATVSMQFNGSDTRD